MGLAFNGIIDYPTAAALVLGQNIGTTVTAMLASIGTSVNARRAALAHTFFNVLGVIIIIPLFFPYIKFVQAFIHWHSGLSAADTVIINGQTTYPHTMEAIAITHTIFNIANTILFLPFTTQLAALLTRLIPEKAVPEEPRLTALDVRLLEAPAIGIEQSQKEIIRMGNIVVNMMATLKELIASPVPPKDKREAIFRKEGDLDVIQKEIVEFVGQIMTGLISHDVEERGRWQIRMADEYESISDYIANILKLNLKMRDANQHITDDGLHAIGDLHDKVVEYIIFINNAVKNDDRHILKTAEAKGRYITGLMKKYRAEHIARVEKGLVTPLKSILYTDMLNAYRRIKDHGFNIAEVLGGEK
jgi:phosphate:Na+ symporter